MAQQQQQQQQQSSRLDRLLTLLDTGSTSATRLTAARQIGDIAKQHPAELNALLKRVRQFLRSKSWETRVAAAQAIGAIAENVHHVTVQEILAKAKSDLERLGCTINVEDVVTGGIGAEQSSSALVFSRFDIHKVLDNGKLLLSSHGKEFDYTLDSSTPLADRLARQKKNLRSRLGLDEFRGAADMSDMIGDEDLASGSGDNHPSLSYRRQEVQQLVANMMPSLPRSLSAREKNRLKRKARVVVKDGAKEDQELEEPSAKRPKAIVTEQSQQGDKLVLDAVLEDDNQDIFADGRWPFTRFMEVLMHDVFDPVWEIRHGSIMALREILTSQAGSAAVVSPEVEIVSPLEPSEFDKVEDKMDVDGVKEPASNSDQNGDAKAEEGEKLPETVKVKEELDLNEDTEGSSRQNVDGQAAKIIAVAKQAWTANTVFLQDCTVRLLCIFALDRFGDFLSDGVVAPVRETCAQVLGAVMKQMHPTLVSETLKILMQMQQCSEWEVRHGSLLGIKYLVAVRQEMIGDLLPQILPACISGLQDQDDDVRAVSADALLPAASTLVSHASHLVKTILALLWNILLDLDDLSPSTSSVMHLLAELYSQPKMLLADTKPTLDLNENVGAGDYLQDLEDLSTLAPRLWPFMRHNISSVRHAAIRTLEQLLETKSATGTFWALPILDDMLRLVFKNLLIESNEQILQCSERVWRLLVQHSSVHIEPSTLASWLKLASSAPGTSVSPSEFSTASVSSKSRSKGKLLSSKIPRPEMSDSTIVIGADNDNSIIRMRVATTSALGVLAANLAEPMLAPNFEIIKHAFLSNSSSQRQVACMVLIASFKALRSLSDERRATCFSTFEPLVSRAQEFLSANDPAYPTPGSTLPYAELSRTYNKMRTEAAALVRLADASKLGPQPTDNISIEAAVDLAQKVVPAEECNGVDDKKSIFETARQRLLATAGYLKYVQSNLHVSVLALMAGMVVWRGELPSKLNPVLQPLINAVKREQDEILQLCAAESLAEVMAHCIGRKPSPNDKLIKNLCGMTCADLHETPVATEANSSWSFEDSEPFKSNRKMEAASSDDKAKLEGVVTRRGAEVALRILCERFGHLVFEKLPKLWDCLTEVIKPSPPAHLEGTFVLEPSAIPQALINNLQVIRVVAPLLKGAMQETVLSLLPAIFGCVRHSHALVRCGAAKCITAMAKTTKDIVMRAVLAKAMPMLTDASSTEARQGAGMLLACLVEGLGVELVAYASFLIVPLLGCMGDSNQAVRQSVTRSFAALVPLLPLARGVPQPAGITCSLDDARFLEQLLDNSRVDDYKLAFELKTTLRRYQQEGINWLAFLKRFKLHGILCDDMGLGKTLQASAIVASDTAERVAATPGRPVLSLIVCPPTLVGHWVYEIEKFIPADVLKPFQYIGQPNDRVLLRNQLSAYSVIITSYDVLRKDIDYLSQILWNYCILDEGHIIKSGKSKVTLAVKRIQAEHRLILSGTPIQNNVLELWSLFDYLMPGFLGSERQFYTNYGKPLTAARDPKGPKGPKDAEAGALAMEALHKQVMPFLLRRTKDEVLVDLPPKIIQDRYCDLCPLQLRLYEKFSASQAKQDVANIIEAAEDVAQSSTPPTHVFQALQYLRKVCSHPLLVMDSEDMSREHKITDLHDIQNSPKLLALRDILEECGIGQNNGESATTGGQHRVLIFAQLKSFLDIIEKDLFQTHMKSVTYLRLDGSVETHKRFEIVKTFNSDPTIDVLLLTTHVGGLGLNLTAADTVVFMEHDWNPTRDLQAMDRAHRLGQRRVVNVHRLIMRGTLEEKVMSLQRFKLSVANAVINAENASLNSMDTTQLLDLFTVSGKKKTNQASTSKEGEAGSGDSTRVKPRRGLKAMMSSLVELWDQSQYSEEYNLGQFVSRLK